MCAIVQNDMLRRRRVKEFFFLALLCVTRTKGKMEKANVCSEF